jgi:hypothetical protein
MRPRPRLRAPGVGAPWERQQSAAGCSFRGRSSAQGRLELSRRSGRLGVSARPGREPLRVHAAPPRLPPQARTYASTQAASTTGGKRRMTATSWSS